jgi:hypothetical protein
MLLLYRNAASMPDFILAMKEAQKKAKRTELPILNIELAMCATNSVLQSGDYTKETDEWEGRNASMKICTNGNKPTWPRTSGVSTANARVPQTNRSVKRPTWSRFRLHMR